MVGRIVEEHRTLNVLFEKTLSLLCGQDRAPDGPGAFEELRDALDVHLSAEEDLYFPAIWSLRPEHDALLKTFIQAHTRFRAILGDVAKRMEGGEIVQAAAALGKLDEAFAAHEGQEEELLRSIDQEVLATIS